MKKIIVLAFVLVLFSSAFSGAEQFNVRNIIYGSSNLKAADKGSGNPLWQSVHKLQKGDGFVYSEEKGSGIWGKDKTYKTWTTKGYFKLQGTKFIPDQVEIVMKDRDGKVVQTMRKSYERGINKVYCEVNGEKKTFTFDNDMIDKEQMGTCASNFDLDTKKDIVFHFLTHEPTRYKMTLKYLGTETIRNIQCHKLQLIPDLGALNIIGAFVPKTYFWVEADPPHDFVRYEGLESGLGTPYIVLDKIK